jgi:adenylate cyclase
MIGRASATAWIMLGMERIVSLGNLPSSSSREDVLVVVLSPDFLGIPVRVIEGVVTGPVKRIAALAVHRARNVVRTNAAAEAERAQMQWIFRSLCSIASGRAAHPHRATSPSATHSEHPLRRH